MTLQILDGLNPSQRKAVEAKDGVHQITSVAGSGKTRVLTSRVAHLIREHGIKPSQILLATFSKKAADEMKERLQKIITKSEVDNLVIGTFHSIGMRILRKEYTIMGHPLAAALNFSTEEGILMGAKQRWEIESIMKDLKIDFTKKGSLTPPEVLGEISAAKNQLIDVKRFSFECITKRDFQIAEIYQIYEQRKNANKSIDFDDMILKLYQLFSENPKILAKYQDHFKYLLIDEAQDNNLAIYRLVEMIAYPHNNIFIVGDDDQSMYRFRGARPDEFVNFKNTFPDVNVISLEQNYRSLPGILDVSNKLIAKNKNRLPKSLVPFLKSTPDNEEVTYSIADNDDHEAVMVVEKIMKSIEEGLFYQDSAIVYRTNSQTRALEEQLIQNGIPYIIYGGTSFYERKEVKDMTAFLQLSIDPNDNEAFERVYNTPSRWLGNAFLKTLKDEAKKKRCSLFKAMKTARFDARMHRNAMNWLNVINKLGTLSSGKTTVELLQAIRQEVKYDDYLMASVKEEDNDNDVLENLMILETAAGRYSDPKEFLDFIKKLVNNRKKRTDSVQLMTIHKAKGLEFKHVYAIGLSNGLLPHKYALESGDPNAIEEERRLAYVALTRAQHKLHISSPLRYGKNDLLPSIFIEDCELNNLVEEKQ